MAETEENKTEEPTPFKLKRARKKGTVARGTDLGFFAALAGLTLFSLTAGPDMARTLAETMRRVFASSTRIALEQEQAASVFAAVFAPAVQSIVVFGAAIALSVFLFEVVQLRGLIFSSQPLKPDFGRLDPAKGIKRLFSMRMLKETGKNIIKMAVYTAAAFFVIRYVFAAYAPSIVDAPSLSAVMREGSMRLLFVFVFLALAFAALDQVIVRREFLKNMRMGRSELTREVKEREGEPRIKRKRKELHAEFTKQNRALGNLRGSDMLIVNPQHYAVALAYDPRTMAAPQVSAKGRNGFALILKQRAAILSIPIFEFPSLARSLYRQCEKGESIPGSEYRSVVDLYLKISSSSLQDVEAPDA